MDNFFTVAFAVRVIAFFETEILLGVTYIAIAFILYGIWNMFNDPLAGFFSDRTTRFTHRWGRRFPWFVITAIPFTIVYLFIFTVPNPADISAFFWLLFTICLFDLFYSFWFNNWLSLFPEKFRSPKERTRVGGLSTVFGQLGVAFGMLVPPLFISYGNLNSYIISAAVMMIIGIICVGFMVPGMREGEEIRTRAIQMGERDEQEPFFRILRFAIKQKNFLVYVFTYLAQMILFMLILGSVPYWVQYILRTGADVEVYISGAFLVGALISVPLWVKLGRKYGNRMAYIIGSGVTALSFIPMLFITGFIPTIVGTAILGITVSAIWTLMYPTYSEVIDEIVVKTGVRREGVYTGIRTFFGRLSNIIGAIVIAVVHITTGFVAEAPTQTPLALVGIRIIMGLVPMLFYILAFILVWKVYDITPEKATKIQNLLKEKKL